MCTIGLARMSASWRKDRHFQMNPMDPSRNLWDSKHAPVLRRRMRRISSQFAGSRSK
jgi:hypothetical protein